jgi:hypothetical protein
VTRWLWKRVLISKQQWFEVPLEEIGQFGGQGAGLELRLALVGEAIAHAKRDFSSVRYFKAPYGFRLMRMNTRGFAGSIGITELVPVFELATSVQELLLRLLVFICRYQPW